ncbi:MAG: glycosyltransferase family 2 protein [Omnitrophica bacterium]|nr:glycosyltransferase family 2 protein [Candidatus Omnitrophota bacterium]
MLPGKSISFVIPMYNESGAIADTIERLTGAAKGLTDDYEIIVSNDASTDNSGAIVDEISRKDPHVKAEHLKKNTKFGGALKAGIYRARKDIIVYTDSDFPIRPEDIREALLLLQGCDMVTAYSKIKKGETFRRVIMSKVYNFLIQFLFRTNIKDINSGFKIFKRKVFKNMRLISESPFIDVEIFVRALKRNFTVKQYPIIFRNREHGKSYISRAPVILRTMTDMLRFKFSRK